MAQNAQERAQVLTAISFAGEHQILLMLREDLR